ncbi:MAG: hypothetical protein ACI9CB_002060, partial [Rhodothermales bacterium]
TIKFLSKYEHYRIKGSSANDLSIILELFQTVDNFAGAGIEEFLSHFLTQ